MPNNQAGTFFVYLLYVCWICYCFRTRLDNNSSGMNGAKNKSSKS